MTAFSYVDENLAAIRARIDAAKNALAFTDQPVARIAENLGYNNLTHFIRQFKALTGVSPSVYRKNINMIYRPS